MVRVHSLCTARILKGFTEGLEMYLPTSNAINFFFPCCIRRTLVRFSLCIGFGTFLKGTVRMYCEIWMQMSGEQSSLFSNYICIFFGWGRKSKSEDRDFYPHRVTRDYISFPICHINSCNSKILYLKFFLLFFILTQKFKKRAILSVHYIKKVNGGIIVNKLFF